MTKEFPKTQQINFEKRRNPMNDTIEFCAKIYAHPDWWGFGACLIHQKDETYICIDFYKWSINIGFMYDDEDDWIDEDFEHWIKECWR